MSATEGRKSKLRSREAVLIASGLAVVAVFTAFDVVSDIVAGTPWVHLAAEFATIIFAGAGAAWLFAQNRRLKGDVSRIQATASSLAIEAAQWRKEAENHVRGVGLAIDKQLSHWQLTPSEKEITFLMLKGLAYKEVATIREVSERTVRQQTLAIYKKSGLSSRAELAAFFLEDLLPPSRDHRGSV